MSIEEIERQKIQCINCGLPASYYFHSIGQTIPHDIKHWNEWYCSESCYNEFCDIEFCDNELCSERFCDGYCDIKEEEEGE